MRFAFRSLLRAPGFTIAAIVSIAIGVGANTAIYSVASALLLHPLPYRGADRLVILWNRSPGLGITEDWFSTAQYFDVKNSHSGFSDLAIAIGSLSNLRDQGNGTDGSRGIGEPERIGTIRMSSNLLPMLGAKTALGRLFTEREDRAGAPDTAILGYATWQRRYGGDPGVLGKTLLLNDRPFQIVGVLDRSFSLPREVMPTLGGAEDAEVVIPLPLGPLEVTMRDREDYNIVGRLKAGVTVRAAQAEMDTITARLRQEHPAEYPPNGGLTFGIVPLREQVVGDVRLAVLVLVGSVAFVLLIACANVANLQLARAMGRQKELAVRAALGAGRARLARQVLQESLLIAASGGVLGAAFAYGGLAFIRAMGTQSVPRIHEIAINVEVLAFTIVTSLACGVLFGVVPALRAGRVDVTDGLKDAGRGSAAGQSLWGRGQTTRRVLVAAEIALAVVLLAGAGLLIRSFARLQRVSPGFNARKVLTFEVTANGRRYSDVTAAIEMYRQLSERLERLPGVMASGAVSALPLSQMFAWGPITVEGRTPAPGEAFVNADMRMVSGRYFQALQIPLVAGRFFDEHDTRTGQRVAIVDAFMAQQLWPGESALGKRLRTGGAGSTTPWLTVVGVVGRVKQYTLDADSRIAMYFPHAQYPARSMNVVARTDRDPAALATAVRQEVRAVDADLPIYRLRTMEERVGESLARRRFAMLLLATFAALALGLAVVGVYGVMSYLVSQSTRELGIRIALGATPGTIRTMILSSAMAVTIVGMAAGLAGALGLTRLMRSLLFQVGPADPVTFLTIPAVLAAAALAATYLPARKAAQIDPLLTIRDN
jgi:putative ABC transport system permease protein